VRKKMPHLDYLKPQLGEPIMPDWGSQIVDLIENIGWEGAVDYYGYVRSDLIPAVDVALNLGIPTNRFKEVHSKNAYFKSLFVEDPIFIQSRVLLLGGQVNAYTPANSKIFPSNLQVIYDGKVRLQVKSDVDNYIYIYHTHSQLSNVSDFALLDSILANKLTEKEITVLANDYLNVMVSNNANLTLLLYNIGNL
jgi:hypothetical protein